MATNKKVLFVLLVLVMLSLSFACTGTPGDGSVGDDIMESLEDTEDILDALDPCGNRSECSGNPDCPNYCAPTGSSNTISTDN